MLDWSQQFSILLFLDTNSYAQVYGRFDCLLAAGAVRILPGNQPDGLAALQDWHSQHKEWLFGHISYDYKNSLEPALASFREANHGFADISFFCPQIVCYLETGSRELTIETAGISPEQVFREISAAKSTPAAILPQVSFEPRMSRKQYLDRLDVIRQHIAAGDCYELNFCSEAFARGVVLNPVDVFRRLNELSPAPFAAFYRRGNSHMMCASPERFLFGTKQKVVSQPIKGTARRNADPLQDNEQKRQLRSSIKEQAENVMIVDLTRNDLARSCSVGSVAVEELFGVYTFPQVHQMISTVSGVLDEGKTFADALRYAFPMGSMTGAPKIKVLELIDRYEQSRRELFSGTVGYISPDGDFDFNVVIRSLFYNAASRYLSYQTGGAITYDSDPVQEWEEMRLKAWALERIFNSGQ